MHRISLLVDGREAPVTQKEAKLMLVALLDYRRRIGKEGRKPSKRETMDMECRDMRSLGYTDAEIGRYLGISARRVRSAISRVENGRYG